MATRAINSRSSAMLRAFLRGNAREQDVRFNAVNINLPLPQTQGPPPESSRSSQDPVERALLAPGITAIARRPLTPCSLARPRSAE